MSTKKYQITQLQQDDSLLVLHPESDADIIAVEKGTGKYEGTASNVQDALEEVYSMAATGGVTGVKGDSETNYRTGNVNITKANIGLGNVTNNAQVKGLASGTTNGDLVKWGADGYTVADAGVSVSTATPSSSSTDAQLPTAKAVYTAISALPTPMQFKGSVGSGGTIEWASLPSAAVGNTGYTYKVITKHTTAPVCEVGDTIISDGTAWVVIPSGDEPSGTVTSVAMTVPTGLSVSGTPITTSGTLAVSYASGYSIPTDANQTAWSAKYDKPSGGIPKTDLASAVQTSLGKADTALQGNQTITLGGDVSGSGATSITVTLGNSGVTAGTYSAVQVNAKGLVTNGGSIIEVGAANQTTPSSSLAVGGIFFKEV